MRRSAQPLRPVSQVRPLRMGRLPRPRSQAKPETSRCLTRRGKIPRQSCLPRRQPALRVLPPHRGTDRLHVASNSPPVSLRRRRHATHGPSRSKHTHRPGLLLPRQKAPRPPLAPVRRQPRLALILSQLEYDEQALSPLPSWERARVRVLFGGGPKSYGNGTRVRVPPHAIQRSTPSPMSQNVRKCQVVAYPPGLRHIPSPVLGESLPRAPTRGLEPAPYSIRG